MLSRAVIILVITVAISFVAIHSIFKVRLVLLGLLVLFLLLFLLLLVFGLFLLLLLFLLLPIAVTILLRLFLVLLLTRLLRIGLRLLILCKNVVGKLMSHVHQFLVTTRRTLVMDKSRFDLVLRLRQAAVGAHHEELNVLVNHILQHLVRVVTIQDGPAGLGVVGGLRPHLTSEELVYFPRITVQTEPHITDVRNNSFATVTTSFQFSKNSWHFVAVFGIINRCCSGDVYNSTWATHLERVMFLLFLQGVDYDTIFPSYEVTKWRTSLTWTQKS
mmetsp:Transcript_21353/g.38250  ORF Transcript_21353/g.38250 Transcript_21353/m.38250 type:complete len:274 (+) Transcript_21353:775-1596(+)